MINNNELYHYGVKGMKWGVRKSDYKGMKYGVRKSDYKGMNRQQRKETRQKYYKTPEGQIKRATRIASFLGGPIVSHSVRKTLNENINNIPDKNISKGSEFANKHQNVRIDATKNKHLKTIEEIDNYYSNKIKSAKNKFEKEMTELEWDEARDDLDERKFAIAY